MDQQKSGQIWQHLQANMASFFGPTRTNDTQKIEYKPRHIALLEMSTENYQFKLNK